MINRIFPLTIYLLLIGCSFNSAAGGALEIKPFTNYRFGGTLEGDATERELFLDNTSNWGFTLSQPASKTARYEFLYSHQNTSLADSTDPNNAFDLAVHYFRMGGSVDVFQDRFTPYFSGGLGMTYINPGQRGYGDETRFSLSVGGGLKWYPTDRFGIRFEMRGYSTLRNANDSLSCNGGCNLQISGDAFPQFETNLGLIFRF
ncbi:MAG: outer membrane beta-barrel protein [Candidatus Thiodiazotropha sp.]|jgi:opacity protein-like surface antigen